MQFERAPHNYTPPFPLPTTPTKPHGGSVISVDGVTVISVDEGDTLKF